MNIRWSDEKNETLKRERGISFEEVEVIIRDGTHLDIIPHPTRKNQKIKAVAKISALNQVEFFKSFYNRDFCNSLQEKQYF